MSINGVINGVSINGVSDVFPVLYSMFLTFLTFLTFLCLSVSLIGVSKDPLGLDVSLSQNTAKDTPLKTHRHRVLLATLPLSQA